MTFSFKLQGNQTMTRWQSQLHIRLAALTLVTIVASALAPANSVVAQGDTNQPKSAAFPVGLVDIDALVLKMLAFPRYAKQMDELKKAGQELQEKMAERESELQQIQLELRKLAPNAPEVAKLQDQFLKAQRELQTMVGKEQESLQSREARIALAIHRELQAELNKIAKERGLKLIVRNPQTKLEDNQPIAEIGKAISRGVLYAEELDLTEELVKRVETLRNAKPGK